ncbi:DUF2812 domain-containing protein [Radiobacillus sp. PE A8.2]|uniref:DUF2812 domain-containing protein n=1 Tax=Radiobacillus sp. PE A8.2 TaxID=3380349 RepID=UPI003890B66D
MSKTVYKLRPNDFWRIGEHESWFTDMAARGLHLKKMGIYFAKFVKGEPKQMKYRIEVSIDKEITSEQIEMYAESGWDYVTRYQFFHVFSSPVELNAPELHTDPAEQSYTLKELDKKLAKNAIMIFIGMLLMFGIMFSLLFMSGTPTLNVIEGGAIQQIITTIFFVYITYIMLQASLSIRALRKNLIEGKAIDHHAPWRKHHRLRTIITLLFTIVIGVSAVIPFVQLAKMDAKTLPEASTDLPIVRLADVEQNPDLIRAEPTYMQDSVDWGNHYSYNWSLFAPVQYETVESGVVPDETWPDGSGEYSPSIEIKVYQLRFPAMAEHLIYDLIDRYEHRSNTFVETQHPAFDLLLVHEEDESKKVYASKGKAVIYVDYFGHADTDVIIDSIVEKVDLVLK